MQRDADLKREAYRRAFDGFDARKVARYDARKVASLLADAGIVRNRAKIASALRRRSPDPEPPANVEGDPPRSAESDAMSKDLKRRGFTFVGSTIVYAHMQAVGMVNDHVVDCFRHREVAKLGRA